MRFVHGVVGALVLALVTLLSGCGAEESEVGPGGHNQADVDFATHMIQHHAQALQMVDLTLGRKLDPEVQQLADEILAAQAPEIEQMSSWLTDWQEPVPETVRDHANAHGHSEGDTGTDLPGMMSETEMTDLEKASGPAFQDLWLDMMIEHHQGAVDMAEMQLDEGAFGSALSLAKRIKQSQTAEIERMENLRS